VARSGRRYRAQNKPPTGRAAAISKYQHLYSLRRQCDRARADDVQNLQKTALMFFSPTLVNSVPTGIFPFPQPLNRAFFCGDFNDSATICDRFGNDAGIFGGKEIFFVSV